MRRLQGGSRQFPWRNPPPDTPVSTESVPRRGPALPPDEAVPPGRRRRDCRSEGGFGRGGTANTKRVRAATIRLQSVMRRNAPCNRAPPNGAFDRQVPPGLRPATTIRGFSGAPARSASRPGSFGGDCRRLTAPRYACLRYSRPRSPLRSGVKTEAAPAVQRPKSCSDVHGGIGAG